MAELLSSSIISKFCPHMMLRKLPTNVGSIGYQLSGLELLSYVVEELEDARR
jgi:hypothetical protein